jgi:hypothetical protein
MIVDNNFTRQYIPEDNSELLMSDEYIIVLYECINFVEYFLLDDVLLDCDGM